LPITIPTRLTLTPLSTQDEDLLCGRAAEVQTIVDNCLASRLTVVTSPPGLGASSLLRAGAEPALRRAGFITVVYSDWQGRSIATRFRDAIVRAVHEQADGSFAAVPELLLELLARAQAKTGRPVAILLDQFEDYVRCHTGTDASNDFDAELANAISTRTGRFVIGLQTPSVKALERLVQYVPNLMGYTINLPPITAEAARELIHKLAARATIEVEPEAVDLLVTAPTVVVAGSGDHAAGVHPLFVTLGAERLFEAEFNLKSKVARASTLLANNGAERLILESLDAPIFELGKEQSELLLRWGPLLVSQDCCRLPAAEKVLVGHAGKRSRFALTLLPLLIKSGLMRTITTPAGVSYELARESTSVVFHDWWVRSEAAVVARQRAQFRVRSISIAVGAILSAYLIYLFFFMK
jgi:hypothetical protein